MGIGAAVSLVGAAEVVTLKEAPGRIDVDGVLGDIGWQGSTRIELPYEWSPGDNVPPPVDTEVMLTYSATHLYIAWRCFDPAPEDIRAHLMDRDDVGTLTQDDHVLVTIDTFNDERRGFQFRVNPMGVQADAIFSETSGSEDFSFDLIWKSAGRIDELGYVVEVAIPFDQLRFERSDTPQTWGFDLQRSYPRNVRHRISGEPYDRNRNCILCQVTKLVGFEQIEPGRNLEIVPTVTTIRSELRDDLFGDASPSSEDDVEPGLNVRWSPTTNLSLNLAVNPDFSQVEADAAQLDVNQRFALFFEEKRPFFLEGADLFSTPIDALFTRTIADPDWGLKLTGKSGKNALGVFVAQDAINNFLIPGSQFSRSAFRDEEVTNGVMRYRRDVGQSSSVGVLWTGREESDVYRNHVFGPDAFLRFGEKHTLRLQYLRSETRYPSEIAEAFGQPTDTLSDDAYTLGYNFDSRKWDGWFWLEDNGTEFRADSGFVPRTDFRSMNFGLLRTIWGDEVPWFDEWNSWVRFRRFEDQSGQLIEEWLEGSTSFSGPLQSFFSLEASYRTERFEQIEHQNLFAASFFAAAQPSGAVRLELWVSSQDEIDLVNNRVGDQLTISPEIEWKAGKRVNLQLDHTYREFELPTEQPLPGGRLFELHLTQLRLVYNLNVRSFVRTILQYQDLTRDPSLFPFAVEPAEETLLTQLLYSYKVNPQTVLFAGYSDNRVGLDNVSLTQTDRTFFLKLGYAWAP